MPAFLVKLFVDVSVATTTVTNVDPGVTRYTATVTAAMQAGGNTTITNTDFFDDTGTAVTGNLPVPVDGFYNVYINGLLQQGGLSTLSTTSLVITDATIAEGVPVVLEISDFAGTTSDSTSTTTVVI